MRRKPVNGAKAVRFVPVLFALIGIGLLGGAVYSYCGKRQFLASATKVTGTVVGMQSVVSRGKNGRSVTYAPTVQFVGKDGQEHTFTSSVSSSPPSYEAGQSVPVVYDPAAIDKAEIDSVWSLFLETIIMGFIGTIFTLVGGGLLFAFNRA